MCANNDSDSKCSMSSFAGKSLVSKQTHKVQEGQRTRSRGTNRKGRKCCCMQYLKYAPVSNALHISTNASISTISLQQLWCIMTTTGAGFWTLEVHLFGTIIKNCILHCINRFIILSQCSRKGNKRFKYL